MAGLNFSVYDIGLFVSFVIAVLVLTVGRGLFGRFLVFWADVMSEKPDDDIPAIGSADAVRIWKKLFWLAYPEAKLMTLALLNALLSSVCSFSHPVYMGRAIDIVLGAAKGGSNVSAADAANRLKDIFIFIAALEVLKVISAYGHERLNNNVGDFVRQRAQVCQLQRMCACSRFRTFFISDST
jgi:hypothetical protein